MKLYIPFNMIVDTDFGIIRIIEKLYNIQEYPIDKIKSFLLKRKNENPVPEYCNLRGIENQDYLYSMIIIDYYKLVLKLSKMTDILSFVINTYKLGLSNDMEITIGCETPDEVNHLIQKLSKLNYSLDIRLNDEINLDDYEYIFNKYINEDYVNYFLKEKKLKGKRLYISDHDLNVLIDDDGNRIIDPLYHIPLESNGIILSLISIYNRKQ